METFGNIILTLIGLILIFSVIRSACKVGLMNYPSSEIISRSIARCVYYFFRRMNSKTDSYAEMQWKLTWFSPLFMLGMISSYFFITLVGFACLYMSFGSEPDFVKACISSGSALSTLGFFTPHGHSGQIISIIEGGVGLGVIVFLITFIPGYQSVVQSRENKSAWLYARTNQDPNCASFYSWLNRLEDRDHLQSFWNNWEDYLRMIGDTHSESPVLLFTPSVRSGQSWLITTFAIMDAVNLMVTSIQVKYIGAAEACLEEGVYSLTRIMQAIQVLPMLHEPRSRVLVSREAYDRMCDQLVLYGFKLKEDHDRSWREFNENRSRYEYSLMVLAKVSFVKLSDKLLNLGYNNVDDVPVIVSSKRDYVELLPDKTTEDQTDSNMDELPSTSTDENSTSKVDDAKSNEIKAESAPPDTTEPQKSVVSNEENK